ncbi:MAG: hypothetical protein IJU83_03275 [Clostridia bacterium]|nr:hypothetical protein [Clostridia bacterium]
MKILNSVWFKCIACLLCIAVVSGALIAGLNDLLYVSAEERTARAIKKIYGENKQYSAMLDVDAGDAAIEYDGMGKINKIYNVDGTVLFQATGYKGYKNGTITLWVQATEFYAEPSDQPQQSEGCERYSITKVMLEKFDKQTLMSKLGGDYYKNFELQDVTQAYRDGKLFSATESTAENYNPVSGATYSAQAGVNAVNCVIKYLGGER